MLIATHKNWCFLNLRNLTSNSSNRSELLSFSSRSSNPLAVNSWVSCLESLADPNLKEEFLLHMKKYFFSTMKNHHIKTKNIRCAQHQVKCLLHLNSLQVQNFRKIRSADHKKPKNIYKKGQFTSMNPNSIQKHSFIPFPVLNTCQDYTTPLSFKHSTKE